ncbi:MAG: YgiQ family radical SAM protein [Desulfatibacillum sp.]|nr:YgiQ family radical SAM protein [Desulfatibacillum sp.]
MFLPTTKQELKQWGWDRLDVILVTGDAYVDSPHVGVAVIGRVLQNAGYRVGIIAQPDMESGNDITRLGSPKLFWGISSGCVDSMVANYTALRKKIRKDDFTPGGVNDRRPDRAVIAYANLVRHHFKDTAPIVLGGVEASLRRVSHYDFYSNAIRRSILFDAKADILVYGMGEKAILGVARSLARGEDYRRVRGICFADRQKPEGFLELPPHDSVRKDKARFTEMFKVFQENQDPETGQGMCQLQDTRYLVHNPPQPLPETRELDGFYELGFQRDAHPGYAGQGPIRALDTIRFSLVTHRGCFGQCNFCAINAHQGSRVHCRSEASVLREARRVAALPDFKGYIADVGGPTANMYGTACKKQGGPGTCSHRRCLWPKPCKNLVFGHERQMVLLAGLANIPGVKKAFVSSGIRYDLILADKSQGADYLRQILKNHISGQMKIAPEHCADPVLDLMGKPGKEGLVRFKEMFDSMESKLATNQFLTYYFMAAHPGCSMSHMRTLSRFVQDNLKMRPQQVQIFTPTPSTFSTLMYHTGKNPFTGETLFVEKDPKAKQAQKEFLTGPPQRQQVSGWKRSKK